ncbi:hypothetical protein GTU99_33575 [Streptomyces sp. PRKS01-65]|nr:hypothetical protein [Streptomyces harenosi]NEY36998.1 hypothetical protein [Streptomyces harenosi]
MKPLKAAAAVAGSLVLAGAAGPAYAHNDVAELTHAIDHTASVVTEEPVIGLPVESKPDAPRTVHKSSALHTAKTVADEVGSAGALLGGLPARG